MLLEEKLQQLRKAKGLTQEQVAKKLFVSRTAVSKWESGRGYPSIESLRQISLFFNVSLDDLLSSQDLLLIAEEDKNKSRNQTLNLISGLISISLIVFFFLPFFGYAEKEIIHEVPITSLKIENYILIPYYVMIILSILNGIGLVMTTGINNKKLISIELYIAFILMLLQTFFFMMSSQPYAGSYTLMSFLIMAIIFIHNKKTR